jgi:hypothetical protein
MEVGRLIKMYLNETYSKVYAGKICLYISYSKWFKIGDVLLACFFKFAS